MRLVASAAEKKKLSDAISDLQTISERIGRLKEQHDSYDIASETWTRRKDIKLDIMEAEKYRAEIIRDNFYGFLK